MKAIIVLLLTAAWGCAQIPRNCSQVVIGRASGWDDTKVTLSVYEKKSGSWALVGKPWQGRLGRNGLAWGYGIHPKIGATKAPFKREGDRRAPAGIFKIGGAYGYEKQITKDPRLPYRTVTPMDLWVEDRNSPHYNRHLILKHPPKSAWEKKAQMRQNDHAHSLKLYIGHNDAMLGGRPVPGLGSAIFFHIWRGGGSKATAGCTTMSEPMLRQLIAHIKPNKNPVYVLLPEAEYRRLKNAWQLP